jgi:hypothetical protein
MSNERHPEPLVRRAQRVLLMVHELHKLGSQRLRISPGMGGSGLHWRCSITHVGNILETHGAMWKQYSRESAHYSTGQSNNYLDWSDAQNDTARQLAAKFIERFPVIVEKDQGIDWEYAGWYVQMLGFADRGVFPIACGDWYEAPDPRWLPTTENVLSGLPMPPGGEAEPEEDRQD